MPIRDPSLFVYELLYSPSRAALYSLAVESSPEGTRTVLAAHTGRQLENRRVLAAFSGEDLGASLAEDAAGRLYSSLGFGPLAVWDGASLAKLDNPGRVARRLAVHEGRLFAVNSDSSLSGWDIAEPAGAPGGCTCWRAATGSWRARRGRFSVRRRPGGT